MIYSNETTVEQIEKRALKFCRQDGEISNNWTSLSNASLRSYVAGASEYAQWKARYDTLKQKANALLNVISEDGGVYSEITALLHTKTRIKVSKLVRELDNEIKSFVDGSKVKN